MEAPCKLLKFLAPNEFNAFYLNGQFGFSYQRKGVLMCVCISYVVYEVNWGQFILKWNLATSQERRKKKREAMHSSSLNLLKKNQEDMHSSSLNLLKEGFTWILSLFPPLICLLRWEKKRAVLEGKRRKWRIWKDAPLVPSENLSDSIYVWQNLTRPL